MNDAKTFWSKVDKNGPIPTHVPGLGKCWLWIGGTRYGQFTFQGRNVLAHRFSYTVSVGPIPKGLQICHRCDNGICVRPDHLFIGTQLDNRRDCVAKGRTAKGDQNGSRLYPDRRARGDRNGLRVHPERAAMGERNAQAILTAPEVLEIRRLHQTGLHTQRKLGVQFGVSYSQIHLIVKRKKWKHI
jgi:hypothetical protein